MNLLKIGLVLVVTFLLVSGPNVVALEEATSETSVEITSGSGITDPEKPIGPPTGQIGPLSIDAVSIFNFGSVKIGETAVAKVEEPEELGIQVTDTRGTGSGWSVYVSISEFIDINSGETLTAVVSIPAGFVSSEVGDMNNAPESFSVIVNKEPTVIFSANKEEGMGTFTNSFEKNDENVKIDTPKGALKGNYQAEMTWTLQDAPV